MIASRVPVLFRGAAADLGLFKESGGDADTLLGRLAQVIGSQSVSVTTGKKENGGVLGYGGFDGHRAIPNVTNISMEFSTLIEQVVAFAEPDADEFIYLQSLNVEIEAPTLLPCLALPVTAISPVKGGTWNLWVGSGDHHVNLHFDHASNFLCLLAGRKYLTLFPPEVLSDLYIGPLEGGPFFAPASLVHPQNPDLEKFPRFADALRHAITVELNPCDTIYIPSHWWHHVKSEGVNIAANFWWKDLSDQQDAFANATFLRSLLHLRSLPEQWRSIWKTFFDYFVFQSSESQYNYLPPEHQGYAGEPTSERLAEICRRIRALEGEASRMHSPVGTVSST